ncbi:hypothetical protein [Sulfitobacter sp. EhC04]|uniref:hypothetical protein n=1 Tax=Sulfitobacter sp. EhC04 TaxID=1849168 RepID=UPI0010FD13E2|nr:hypothetical protein [Sulfitobacter sp. EhC04]
MALELKRTFAFLASKPESALGPVAITPNVLVGSCDGKLVGGRVKVTLRGEVMGVIDTGIDCPFY